MKKIKLFNEKKKTFEEFISDCVVRNLRTVTMKSYQDSWKHFRKYITKDDIKQEDITNYILAAKDTIKATTMNKYLRHIRAILYFMECNVKIKMLKVDFEHKTPYTKDEAKKLLEKPDIRKVTFIDYRNWVVVNTVLATGARTNTLVNIKIKDVDLTNGFIKFATLKNRKMANVPIPNMLVKILHEYIEHRNADSEEYLFCNAYGRQTTRTDLYHSMCNYNKARGITNTGIHRLRHTFAKEYMLAGGDIFTLQKILTHASVSQTQQYINMLDVDVQAMVKINPLEILTDNKTKIKMK